MRESELEESVCRAVEKRGGLSLKLKVDGQRGFPDRLILLPDHKPLFVELKKPGGGKVSPQQRFWLIVLNGLGVRAIVADTLEDVEKHL